VEISGFWQRQEVWSSHTSSYKFLGAEKLTRLQRGVKKAGLKTHYTRLRLRVQKDKYEEVASFKPPSERWNVMYQFAPGKRTRNFESPTWESASFSHFVNHLQRTDVISALSKTWLTNIDLVKCIMK
jgi:hypothetical protein